MKRMYEKPMAYAETFVANEYVAACYSLSCEVGKRTQNPIDHRVWNNSENGPNRFHEASGTGNCSDPGSNYLTVNSRGDFISLEEWRSDMPNGHGGTGAFLPGTKIAYSDLNNSKKYDAGDYVSWTTKASDGRVWKHWGYLHTADPKHPNHS